MSVKAVPTNQLVKEYGNYILMTGIAAGSGTILYSTLTGDWPGWDVVILAGSGAACLPAVALAGRSLTRLFTMVNLPQKPGILYASRADDTMKVNVNGKEETWMRSVMRLAFDPSVGEDQGVRQRVMKYKTPVRPMVYWDMAVRVRQSAVTVRLYEDTVIDILFKAWRRQMHGQGHPLSARAMTNLKYSTLNGRRLSLEEFYGFVELADRYRIIDGRRAGTSGRLMGDPKWCMGQLLEN